MPSVSNLRGEKHGSFTKQPKTSLQINRKMFLSNNGSFLTTNMEVKGKSSILN